MSRKSESPVESLQFEGDAVDIQGAGSSGIKSRAIESVVTALLSFYKLLLL